MIPQFQLQLLTHVIWIASKFYGYNKTDKVKDPGKNWLLMVIRQRFMKYFFL